MKKLNYLFDIVLASFVLILSSCDKTGSSLEPKSSPVISISRNLITLSPGGPTISDTFRISSNTNWTIINGNPSWLSLSQSSGTIGSSTVIVSGFQNNEFQNKVAELIVYSTGDSPKTITVQQEAASRLLYIAGTEVPGYQDGDASSAQFYSIRSLAATGSIIYVADEANQVVRKVDLNSKIVSTLTKSPIGNIWSVAVDIYGNVYATNNQSVLNINNLRDSSVYFNNNLGTGVNFVAGTPNMSGGIYFVDGNQINKVTETGSIVAVAGDRESPGYQDGPGNAARFNSPDGIAIGFNSLYVIDSNPLVRAISLNGIVSTIAGTSEKGFRDGPVKQAQFHYMQGITVTYDGTIYVLDQSGFFVRKITSDGYVRTLSLPNTSLQFYSITSVGNWIFVTNGQQIFQLY